MGMQNRANKVLIIGGAKSGKTQFALTLGESMLISGQKGLYVATCDPLDDEMRAKVLAHQKERSKRWDTLEEKTSLKEATAQIVQGRPYGVILVDCLTLWVLNIMEQFPGHEEEQIKGLVEWFGQMPINVIAVTNEVGLGIVPEGAFTRRYRDLLGLLNQEIARSAQDVFFVMAGINMKLKGGDHEHR